MAALNHLHELQSRLFKEKLSPATWRRGIHF
jgi:hypothetical protein